MNFGFKFRGTSLCTVDLQSFYTYQYHKLVFHDLYVNRNMHSLMSTVSPDTIAAMSGGSMSPEMVKFATNMMKQMSPEDMERMVGLASNVHVPAPEDAPVTMTTPGMFAINYTHHLKSTSVI